MFSQQEIGCTNAKVLAAVSRWSAMKDTGSSWMMFKCTAETHGSTRILWEIHTQNNNA